MFQAALLAGAAMLSGPISVLPCRTSVQSWFGSSRDTAVGQGRALVRRLPDSDLPPEDCSLAIPPEYNRQLQSGQVEGFAQVVEDRLGLLQRRIDRAWKSTSGGWEVTSGNILIGHDQTFARIYYYYGRTCDDLRLLQLGPNADELSELHVRVLHDYAAARRALELAESTALPPVRSDQVASTVTRTITPRNHDTIQEPVQQLTKTHD